MALAILKQAVTKWLRRLLEAGEVIAPVRTSCGDILFSTVRSADEVVWEPVNPLHPPKAFVLPQTDPLVKIQSNGRGVEVEPIQDSARRFLFNVRSCDAKGIAFLTRIHEPDPPDASYLRRSNNLTIISMACTTPCPLGFCVCTDSGPFLHNSYDIQLTDWVSVISPRWGTPRVNLPWPKRRAFSEPPVNPKWRGETTSRRLRGIISARKPAISGRP